MTSNTKPFEAALASWSSPCAAAARDAAAPYERSVTTEKDRHGNQENPFSSRFGDRRIM